MRWCPAGAWCPPGRAQGAGEASGARAACPAAGQPCAARVQHGLTQAEIADLIGIRGNQAAAVISELDVIVTPHPRRAGRKGRAAIRRARAAARARGAFISARIFRAALGTGQHHDGATYVIAGRGPTSRRAQRARRRSRFQESSHLAGAFQPEDPLVYRGAVLARHLTGTATWRPRRLRPPGSLEIPLVPRPVRRAAPHPQAGVRPRRSGHPQTRIHKESGDTPPQVPEITPPCWDDEARQRWIFPGRRPPGW